MSPSPNLPWLPFPIEYSFPSLRAIECLKLLRQCPNVAKFTPMNMPSWSPQPQIALENEQFKNENLDVVWECEKDLEWVPFPIDLPIINQSVTIHEKPFLEDPNTQIFPLSTFGGDLSNLRCHQNHAHVNLKRYCLDGRVYSNLISSKDTSSYSSIPEMLQRCGKS